MGIYRATGRRIFRERGLNRGQVWSLWNIRRSEKMSTQEAGGKCGFDVLNCSTKEYSIISELPSSKETSLWLSGYNGQKGKFSLLSVITFGLVCWNKYRVVPFEYVKSYWGEQRCRSTNSFGTRGEWSMSRFPPPFPPCPWADSSRHFEGCLHVQIMQKNFLVPLVVLPRHFKTDETSAAVQTHDNCSPFPHTSADLHSHCKEPKPIYLSLVCGLWPVLVAFVGLRLYVYWAGGNACVLVKQRIEMWTAKCLERDLFYLFPFKFHAFFCASVCGE
jgi:hypothetical protein